jgi:hypothetical protein
LIGPTTPLAPQDLFDAMRADGEGFEDTLFSSRKQHIRKKALQKALHFRPESNSARPIDPGLAKVIAAWPKLPNSLRSAIVAIVQTSK